MLVKSQNWIRTQPNVQPPSRNASLAIAVENDEKADTRVFYSFVILLNLFKFYQFFFQFCL